VAQAAGSEFKPQYRKKKKEQKKSVQQAGHQWFMPIILATQEDGGLKPLEPLHSPFLCRVF
jgi:hypothetical protein